MAQSLSLWDQEMMQAISETGPSTPFPHLSSQDTSLSITCTAMNSVFFPGAAPPEDPLAWGPTQSVLGSHEERQRTSKAL